MKALKLTFVSCVLYAGLILLSALGMTSYAEAAEMPMACTATAPVISNFHPYVYEDGELHSFDYYISAATPVVAATVVGDHPLESRYSTIWQEATAPAEKKIHVDVPSWYEFSGEVQIAVSVATGPNMDCLSHQQFVVQLPSKQQKQTAGTEAATLPAPAKEDFRSRVGRKYEEMKKIEFEFVMPILDTFSVREIGRGAYGMGEKMQDMKEKMFSMRMGERVNDMWKKAPDFKKMHGVVGEGTATKENARAEHEQFVNSIQALVAPEDKKECASWPAAAWVLLTVISVAIVLMIVDSLPYLLAGGGMRFGLALLAMFLAMIGLWFLFDRCHNYRWFPVAITIITLFTLIAPTNLGKKRGGMKKKTLDWFRKK